MKRIFLSMVLGFSLLGFGNIFTQSVFQSPHSSTVYAQEEAEEPTEQTTIAPTCEVNIFSVSLEWIMCPILRAADRTIGAFTAVAEQDDNVTAVADAAIDSILTIDAGVYSPDGDAGNTYYAAWGNMRNLATIAVVLTAMFMVISTALDMGFFSNYTVKKYLPRLVIATIGIQFSWFIFALSINMVQQLGDGIQAIMFSSFDGAQSFTFAEIFGARGGAAALFAGGTGVAAIALGSLTVFGVGAVAISVMGTLFFVFVAFLLRRIVVVALLILSPLAIAAWVLPGNDKVWSLWKNTFFGLLFVYPVLKALIATGKIFAYVSVGQGGNGASDLTSWLMGIIAFVSGYAMGPYAIKTVGGSFGTLTGQLNDRSKGLFDRGRNYMSERDKGIKDRTKERNMAESRVRMADGNANRRDRFRLGMTGTGVMRGAAGRANAQYNAEQRAQGHADAVKIDNATLEANVITAQANRIEQVGNANVTIANPQVALDMASAKVAQSTVDAAHYDTQKEMSKIAGDSRRKAAENQAFHDYAAQPLTPGSSGNLELDKARVDAAKIGASTRAYDFAGETQKIVGAERQAATEAAAATLDQLENANPGGHRGDLRYIAQMGMGAVDAGGNAAPDMANLAAAAKKMAKTKDAAGLRELQTMVANSGDPALVSAWSDVVNSNYDDLKGVDAGLVAKPVAGAPATALDAQKLDNYSSADDKTLSGMDRTSWAQYRSLDAAGAEAAAARIAGNTAAATTGNDKLTAEMNRELLDDLRSW